MEYLDVLDEKGQKTGKVKSREAIHRDGDWHEEVHIWIINSKGELLMQHRSPKKAASPDRLDVSFGGHVQSGSTSLEVALREGFEELGLELNNDDLLYLFRVSESTQTSLQINRVFNDIFLLKKDLDPETLTLQTEEVAGVKFVFWREVRQRIEEKDPKYSQHPEGYMKLFEYLEKEF